MQYLGRLGFRIVHDPNYPDLAVSLSEAVVSRDIASKERPAVGLDVIEYAGKYSNATPNDNTHNNYLNSLITLVTWLLSRSYDIRLLIGDLGDVRAKQKFKDLLRERLSAQDEERIIDEPMTSVEDVLSHIAATDIVVATRFHNVLFALIAISR